MESCEKSYGNCHEKYLSGPGNRLSVWEAPHISQLSPQPWLCLQGEWSSTSVPKAAGDSLSHMATAVQWHADLVGAERLLLDKQFSRYRGHALPPKIRTTEMVKMSERSQLSCILHV